MENNNTGIPFTLPPLSWAFLNLSFCFLSLCTLCLFLTFILTLPQFPLKMFHFFPWQTCFQDCSSDGYQGTSFSSNLCLNFPSFFNFLFNISTSMLDYNISNLELNIYFLAIAYAQVLFGSVSYWIISL